MQRASTSAHTLWDTKHRRQVGIWFDDFRCYRLWVDPNRPDLTLNCTAATVLQTTTLTPYPGLPEPAEIEAGVPQVSGDIFQLRNPLFDLMDVTNRVVKRVWLRASLDIARKDIRSFSWTPFVLSELRCGTHKELLQLVCDLRYVEHHTRHCVPLLVDMEIHFALLKV